GVLGVVNPCAIAVIGLLAVGLPATHTSQAPQTPPPSGIVAGGVIDQSSGRPIPDATVTVTLGATGASAVNLPQRVMTDPAGRFAFAGWPAAGLALQASKAGYASALNETSLNVDLRNGERI